MSCTLNMSVHPANHFWYWRVMPRLMISKLNMAQISTGFSLSGWLAPAYERVCVCVCVFLLAYVCARMCVHARVHGCVCISVWPRACVCLCMCMHACVYGCCMHINALFPYTCTHTHTHMLLAKAMHGEYILTLHANTSSIISKNWLDCCYSLYTGSAY